MESLKPVTEVLFLKDYNHFSSHSEEGDSKTDEAGERMRMRYNPAITTAGNQRWR